MGCAYRKLGQETAVRKYFAKATQGSSTPEVSRCYRCYNDQSSGYIYYQGLAFHALDADEKAKKSFHPLIIFGERHIFDRVEDDFLKSPCRKWRVIRRTRKRSMIKTAA